MKTFRLFSMAALALTLAACSSEDNEILQNTQQPGTMHFTATIAAPSGDATTRTVYTEEGTTINVKWKVGDQIALVHNGVKDVATVKTVDDVTGKATIEADITGSPSDDDDVYLAYPADAVYSATPYGEYGLPFTPAEAVFDKVKHYQDGTLAYIQDNLDLRMGPGKLAVSGSDVSLKGSVSIPSIICIWKLTLQDNASTPLSATKLTFKNNDDTQAKATSAAKSEYYLCVVPSFIPDPSGTFSFEATVGSDTYIFWKTGLSLTAGMYYQSTVKMTKATDLSSISSDYEVKDGEILTGTLGSHVKISIADGATVTLKDVNITNLDYNCDWAGITCLGDATLVLEGTNEVCAGIDDTGEFSNYPAIYIAPGQTLTIQGAGTLSAYSYAYEPYGAGIGGGYDIPCGHIVINSGNIKAQGGEYAAGIGGGYGASCGNITINGGTITATGGARAAGIGGGYENGDCGTITIKSTVTSVTAMKGNDNAQSIGKGEDGKTISVTLEDGANVTQE